MLRRSSKPVCAHARWAARARPIAGATSSTAQRGTVPSSPPVNGCSTSIGSRAPAVRTRAASASSCAALRRADGIRAAVAGGAVVVAMPCSLTDRRDYSSIWEPVVTMRSSGSEK
jgi:hypothetical protein